MLHLYCGKIASGKATTASAARVERRFLRPAEIAVCRLHQHVLVAERRQPALRLRCKRLDDVDAHDLALHSSASSAVWYPEPVPTSRTLQPG